MEKYKRWAVLCHGIMGFGGVGRANCQGNTTRQSVHRKIDDDGTWSLAVTLFAKFPPGPIIDVGEKYY